MPNDPLNTPPTQPRAAVAEGPPTTAGSAVASLVLGLLGFITLGLCGLAGIITGIIALVSISRSDGRKTGSGLAACGISLGAISLVTAPIALVVVGVMLPAVATARSTANTMRAKTEATAAAMTFIHAAADSGAITLDGWTELELQPSIVVGDGKSGDQHQLALNTAMIGVDPTTVLNANAVVLFFEAAEGAAPSGGADLLPDLPASDFGFLVIQADGMARHVPVEESHLLVWIPEVEATEDG